MGYPTATIKAVFGGEVSEDIWRTSFDIRLEPANVALTQTQLDAITTDIGFAIGAVCNVLDSHWAASTRFSFLNVYFYPLGSTQASLVSSSTPTPVPGVGTAYMPNPVCCAVEKKTLAAGRRNRGRMYWPMTAPAGGVDVSGETSGTVPLAYAQQTATLFNSVNAANWTAHGVTDQFVCVTSSTRTSLPLPVTSVRANSIPDYQRRRKSEQVANFTEQSNVTV